MAWNPLGWLRPSEVKSFNIGSVLEGQLVLLGASGEAFIKDGYQANPQLFSVISRIAQRCSEAKFKMFSDNEEVEEHPLLDLLNRPNPLQGQPQFLECLVGYYKINGEVFVHTPTAVTRQTAAVQMWIIPSVLLKEIKYDALGMPTSYHFQDGGKVKTISAEEIIHWKSFNPSDKRRGMSPIQAARGVLTQSNAGYAANAKLLQNGGAKGVLTLDDAMGRLTPEQAEALQDRFEKKYTGATNWGKVIISGQKMSWQEIGLSAVDLNILESQKMSLRDICNVYQCPVQLFNQTEGSTFNNMQEAKRDFIDSAIIPTLNSFINLLEISLIEVFEKFDSKQYRLEVDKSVYPELNKDIKELAPALNTAWWFTPNQKLEFMDMPASEVEGMDMVYIPSNMVPIDFSEPTATEKLLQYEYQSQLRSDGEEEA